MCGRYTGHQDESDALKTIYTELNRAYPRTVLHSGEIFPTNTVPLLRESGNPSFLSIAPAVWGYPGRGGKGLIINARSESASEKPLFVESLRQRRCVIPTTGYYEWSPDRQKHLFRLPGTGTLFLAGLWRQDADGIRFVILTAPANASTADIHPRMPVVLLERHLLSWVNDPDFARMLLNAPQPNLVHTSA